MADQASVFLIGWEILGEYRRILGGLGIYILKLQFLYCLYFLGSFFVCFGMLLAFFYAIDIFSLVFFFKKFWLQTNLPEIKSRFFE
jgi:hypothetical protein